MERNFVSYMFTVPQATLLSFWQWHFAKLSDLAVENTIVGGDFNCLTDPLMDRFPLGISSLSKQLKHITNFCKDMDYVDVWRTLHTVDKEYTFFSNCQKCYTRIDYFFTTKTFLESVASCSIGNIIMSDHAAVYLDVRLKNPPQKSRSWRMDTSILKDIKFTSYITSEFRLFLSVNSPSSSNPSLLWKTSKVYARGLIISYTASKRHQNMEQ